MPKLIITRGLPGSGKSTWAKEWVAKDIANRARVNRDDLRGMVHNGEWRKGVTETAIIAARNASILALFRSGKDVVVDDTNLPARVVRDLMKLAGKAGAGFEVKDFTHVPLQTCIARDLDREKYESGYVGATVITDTHKRFLAGKKLPLPIPELEPDDTGPELIPYVPVPGKPGIVLCDIDGTVALMGDRGPFDETRVSEDEPNTPIVNLVRNLQESYDVVFMSGRTEGCRNDTADWLMEHVRLSWRAPLTMHMRAVGDGRPDYIVKAELFDRHIRNEYNVRYVLDDRNSVVAMWRKLGLTVLQVADGPF